MINLNTLQQKYIEQVATDFDNHRINPFPHNWREGVPLLFSFVQTDASLSQHFFVSLQAVLIDDPTSYNNLAGFINYLEKYLKLVCSVVKPDSDADTLFKFMEELIIFKGNKFKCRDRKDSQQLVGEKPFLELLCLAYCTRNDVAHAKKEHTMPCWSQDQMTILKNRNGALTLLLLVTLQYKAKLLVAVQQQQFEQEPQFVTYLQKTQRKFARGQKRFVALQGYEKIELYAREELEDEDRPALRGSIVALREKLSGQQFMLLGDAGMGKTTTLQYLAGLDAQACLVNPSATPLPVYIELKLLSGQRRLLQAIINTLGFTPDFVMQLLQEKRLAVFLDGLNEVPKNERDRVAGEIQSLLHDYPGLPLIVAGRASFRFLVDDQRRLPVFALQRMDDDQLEEFLEKNSAPSVRALIQAELAEPDNLRDWLRVPMLFMMLLEVAEDFCRRYPDPDQAAAQFQEHTENKTLVIQTFVHKMYRREADRDARFGEVAFDTLLSALAAKIFELYQSSAALLRTEVVKTILPQIRHGFPDTDLDYFLATAEQLGILARDDNLYSFAHEEYFDFYAEQGMEL